jgi:tetratricopeptide (TPR) repeat protein
VFAAISHGCSAGLHRQVMIDVFWKRIRRKGNAFNIKKLGSLGMDLAALSHFYEVPWNRPAIGLHDEDVAMLLDLTGFDLRGVGRSHEALQLMESALEKHIVLKHMRESARVARNISELMLILGDLNNSLKYAFKSLSFAEQGSEVFWIIHSVSIIADVLFQLGKWQEARQLFIRAEEIAELGNMKLYLCEYLLEAGRLYEAEGKKEKSEQHFKNAANLVKEMGYWRREKDVEQWLDKKGVLKKTYESPKSNKSTDEIIKEIRHSGYFTKE